MIILDTNAVYYASGISLNCNCNVDRLLEIIDGKDEICITTFSFYEIICKYHSEVRKIRKIFIFIRKHNIQIINEKRESLSKEEINKLSLIRNAGLLDYYNDIRKKKMNYEATVSRLILLILSFSYVFFYLELNGYKYNKAIEIVVKDRFFFLDKKCGILLKEKYKKSYSEKNAQKYLSQEFDSLLAELISLWVPFIDRIYNEAEAVDDLCKMLNEFFSDISIERKEKLLHQIEKKQTSIRYLKNYAQKYKRENGEQEIDNFFNKLYATLKKIIGNEICRDYLLYIIKIMIENGASYQKNDISDWSIISLVREDGLLITFDKKMIGFLKIDCQ